MSSLISLHTDQRDQLEIDDNIIKNIFDDHKLILDESIRKLTYIKKFQSTTCGQNDGQQRKYQEYESFYFFDSKPWNDNFDYIQSHNQDDLQNSIEQKRQFLSQYFQEICFNYTSKYNIQNEIMHYLPFMFNQIKQQKPRKNKYMKFFINNDHDIEFQDVKRNFELDQQVRKQSQKVMNDNWEMMKKEQNNRLKQFNETLQEQLNILKFLVPFDFGISAEDNQKGLMLVEDFTFTQNNLQDVNLTNEMLKDAYKQQNIKLSQWIAKFIRSSEDFIIAQDRNKKYKNFQQASFYRVIK